MTPFVHDDFLGDSFQVSSARVKASDLLGFGYFISDVFWNAEARLPDVYIAEKLQLRNFAQADRVVSWPEVDMLLNMESGVIPVGWRVIYHLYNDQDLIPPPWLSHLLGGNLILFPYTVCALKKGSELTSPIYCVAFFYDFDVDAVECTAMSRYATGATVTIGVYQE